MGKESSDQPEFQPRPQESKASGGKRVSIQDFVSSVKMTHSARQYIHEYLKKKVGKQATESEYSAALKQFLEQKN